VPQHKLQRIVRERFTVYFAYHSFELYYHDHFLLVTRATAKVKPPAFKLVDLIRLGAQEVFVINAVWKRLVSVL
jgi:hypothetical protein